MNAEMLLVEDAVVRGVEYFAKSLAFFWPSQPGVRNKEPAAHWNIFSEKNILLHVSRALAENNFYVWAEIPFAELPEDENDKRVMDLVAYNRDNDITLMIELKNNIDAPRQIYADVDRVIQLSEKGLCWDTAKDNDVCISEAANRLYGLVTVLGSETFEEWWSKPLDDAKEGGRRNATREKTTSSSPALEKILETTCFRDSIPLENRSCWIGYAVFDQEMMKTVKSLLE